MASTPTTKSQVQAYKFVIRRMESALARKDAVMLHDPLGSHKRATIAGVILAGVGVIGFLVWGLFGGQGSVPKPGSVVIAKESGSVYVVTSDDEAKKRLIPMLNMASAKLLVMAKGGGGQGQAIKPTVVQQSALAQVPRGPKTGMPNAPEFLPGAKNRAEPSWAICDVGQLNSRLSAEQAESSAKVTTTVLGGTGKHGHELRMDQSLYVKERSSDKRYLIYRVNELPGQGREHVRTVKAQVNTGSEAVMEMFGLQDEVPRTISTNMLNAIPEVGFLTAPKLPEAGAPSYMRSGDYQLGDVVRRTVPGPQPDEYFVLLPEGKQKVSQGAAAVIHASRYSSQDIPNATGALTQAPYAENSLLRVGHFPTAVPSPVSFRDFDTSCLSWTSEFGNHHVTVTLSDGSPSDKAPVKLAQYDGTGPRVDHFYMPPGKAAVVRGTTSESGNSGPIYLVSDRGVKFGIKDVATAQGLGVIHRGSDIQDAPPAVLSALPSGAYLDPAQASFVYDTIPLKEDAGVNRPPKKSNGQAGPAQAANSGS